MHRRVAELLEGRQSEKDQALSLEIAWHWLRGGDTVKAAPSALAGSEAALQAGAPFEAEQILSALAQDPATDQTVPRLYFILAKALVSQSKAATALPLLDRATRSAHLDGHDQAELLLLQALAEYLLGHHGSGYCELTSLALKAALQIPNRDLVGRAMFEYARSGLVTAQGSRVRETVRHLDAMVEQAPGPDSAMLFYSRAYCRFYLADAFGALGDMQHALTLLADSPDLVQQALAYNGYASCLRAVGRTAEAKATFERALGLSLRIGDDSRTSILLSVLCQVENSRGHYDAAMAYGLQGIDYARRTVGQCPLGSCYLGLAEASAMMGRISEVTTFIDQARASLGAQPTHEDQFLFDLECAGLALLMGSTPLALKMIESAQRAVQGSDALPYDAGVFEKFRAFRTAHTEGLDAALLVVQEALDRFRSTHPLNYISVLAAKAWLERKLSGCHSADTEEGLQLLTAFGLEGKRALLVAQGFLIGS
jgi:tetratricopeptide (TPR) repeat protein